MTKKETPKKSRYIRWTALPALGVLIATIIALILFTLVFIRLAHYYNWQPVITYLDPCGINERDFTDNKLVFMCGITTGSHLLFNSFIWSLLLLYPLMFLLKKVKKSIDLFDVVVTQLYVFLLIPFNKILLESVPRVMSSLPAWWQMQLEGLGSQMIVWVNVAIFMVFILKVEKWLFKRKE